MLGIVKKAKEEDHHQPQGTLSMRLYNAES